MRTAVALGSNLGDRLENLRMALRSIAALNGVSPPILASPVYETEPVECEPGSETFYNAVVEFDYAGEPEKLLAKLIEIEESLGRKRTHAKNSSRSIDLDLLYWGPLSQDNGQLQLPHPRMIKRCFVLKPLADIRPTLVLPGQTRTVAQLLAQLGESSKVVRLSDNWKLP